ncbi:MAG TPA: Gfo/Idh/MocA family oxidoreductase [Gemmatimonadaceae bacterium]|nr:Gfo/Idh/MocA family oxidoreductase [Gemmatimonadaceae bacterium]
MYRAAVIGCGKIGSELSVDPFLKGDVFTHAEAYTRCARTELVALCDSDLTKLDAAAQLWKAEGMYAHASDLIASEKLDIVSICTPTATHGEVLRAVLDSANPPRAILCEKPLGMTLAESEMMAELAASKKVILATVYMRRYAKNFRALRKFLDEGGIGKLQTVTGLYIKGTFHNGTHWFDMLRYLCGEVGMVSGLNMIGETREDPTLDVALFLRSGVLATLRACDHTAYTVFEMELFGTEGRVRIVDSGFEIELYKPMPSERYAGYVELQRVPMDFGDRRDLMLHAVEDIVDCLETGKDPLCTAADGVEAARIADAAMRSPDGGVVSVTD